MKRSRSPETGRPVKRNAIISQARARTPPTLSSLTASVSPPRLKNSTPKAGRYSLNTPINDGTNSLSLAAVEAGEVKAEDPVELFSERLAAVARPLSAYPEGRRLPVKDWIDLYSRNRQENGCHFVIHQHDHPIAGPHYDLRLQFSGSSSLSWAIMYGLPGNPNSYRINRNATETRVHCLWNHLIETASRNTGSMIIWDTGEYEVLPYYATHPPETDDSASDISNISAEMAINNQLPSESEKLKEAFQNRKIRLRLHGTRLPKNYTISLRVSTKDDNAARARPITQKRRRRGKNAGFIKKTRTPSTSRSPSPDGADVQPLDSVSINGAHHDEDDINGAHSASGSESEDTTDTRTRLTNAYPGAVNSIGSIHQRRWFITLDRANSGFIRDGKSKTWKRKFPSSPDQDALGFEPFYVRGPEFERSVVTGRTGNDVLNDENVVGFTPRRGWRPVLN